MTEDDDFQDALREAIEAATPFQRALLIELVRLRVVLWTIARNVARVESAIDSVPGKHR
jgi:hypothetical protein